MKRISKSPMKKQHKMKSLRAMKNSSSNPVKIPLLGVVLLLCLSCQPLWGQGSGHEFEKIQLSSTFYAEGAGIGDINGDGRPDVVAGPYWYEGPDFADKHAFYEPRMFDPRNYSDNFIAGVDDVNGDGSNDILVVGFPGEAAYWYENPGESNGYWERHLIHESVDNESPQFYDLDGDGSLELVFHTGGRLGYAARDAEDPTRPWSFTAVSGRHDWGKFTHGLGIGDIDGDGHEDILKKEGWWENPGTDQMDSRWRYHEAAFAGPGGAQMYAFDVDGDGLNDVITSLDAHGWGLAWHRQHREGDEIRFEQRLVMGSSLSDSPYGVRFSQPHALELADMDQDGVKDVISGKRFWAHGPQGGFEPNAPAVVYWFNLQRGDPGSAGFVPYLVDDDSGLGVQIAAGDLTGNGYPDIVTSNKKGTFVFLNHPP